MMGDSSPVTTASIASSRSASPACDLPFVDEHPALQVPGAGDQVCVSKAIADLGGAGGRCVRARIIAFAETLLGDRQEQVTVLHAVTALDEPLRPREPAGRLSGLASEEKIETQPEGTARGAHAVAGVEMRVMSTIEDAVKIEVSADQVRRRREQLEILDSKGSRPVCERERLVGVTPCSTPVRLATHLKLVGHPTTQSIELTSNGRPRSRSAHWPRTREAAQVGRFALEVAHSPDGEARPCAPATRASGKRCLPDSRATSSPTARSSVGRWGTTWEGRGTAGKRVRVRSARDPGETTEGRGLLLSYVSQWPTWALSARQRKLEHRPRLPFTDATTGGPYRCRSTSSNLLCTIVRERREGTRSAHARATLRRKPRGNSSSGNAANRRPRVGER